ncbi:MAG: hypothetical protein LBG27_01255 [Spirochaetaceae bacterium]|nr:hypothetical protein [Spirochaetaceae bacterium]
MSVVSGAAHTPETTLTNGSPRPGGKPGPDENGMSSTGSPSFSVFRRKAARVCERCFGGADNPRNPE